MCTCVLKRHVQECSQQYYPKLKTIQMSFSAARDQLQPQTAGKLTFLWLPSVNGKQPIEKYSSLQFSHPSDNSGKHYPISVTNPYIGFSSLTVSLFPLSHSCLLESSYRIQVFLSGGAQTSTMQYYSIYIELKNRPNLSMVIEVRVLVTQQDNDWRGHGYWLCTIS